MKLILSFFWLIAFPLLAVSQKTFDLKGSIEDENLKGLRGASVVILNSRFSTVTIDDGTFFFKDVYAGSYILNVSRIGYATINRRIIVAVEMNDLKIILPTAHAQLSEVIVTAQKREELAQRLPVSITTLSSRDIENYDLRNINDLTAIVPNSYTADPGDKRSVTSIRGITTTSYDPAVAVYIDGVNQFGLDTYIAQLFDVERIEVLRGPQGTLYGRNAMGGVINIITKRPRNATSGFAEATFGGYGQKRFTAGVRAPLIKDKLFFGAAGLYESLNGFYKNDFYNSNYDKQHNISGNYFLNYLPARAWTLSFNLKHAANRNNGAFPLVFGIEEALKNPYRLNQNAVTTMVDNILNTSAAITHTGRNFNFNSVTAYQTNYRFYRKPIDADFSPLDAITIINNYGKNWNHVNVITQELKFSSSGDITHPLKWTVGTYFFHQYSPVKQTTRFGEEALLAGFPDKNFSLISTTISKSTGLAVYGQGAYKVSEKLNILAGLRYDIEHKNQSVLGEYQKDPDPSPAFDFRSDTSAIADFSSLSPKLSIAYNCTDNSTAYISYSKGFRAGGLTPLTSDPSQPPLYRYLPEHSNNVEIGLKNTLLKNKLLLNTTFFYTKVSDVQVPTLILPDAITITKNTGELISRGAELEIIALVVKGFEINYNAGYTKATYTALTVSQNSTSVNLQGKRQIFSPDVTSMLALQYNTNIGKKKRYEIFIRSEWKYLGKQYFDVANTIKQVPYNLFNALFGVALRNISLSFWGQNLTNKKYIQYGYDFGAVRLGAPLLFGATVRVKR